MFLIHECFKKIIKLDISDKYLKKLFNKFMQALQKV